jgi:heme/copper-type cytochrome/quinol oxidase subunit 4
LRSIVCILPFPALIKVTERLLRIAICCVYSIAVVAIIVTIMRIVLLATDVENSIKRIMVLTTVEVTVCIVIGILPGISSTFTKRYAQGGSDVNKSSFSSRLKSGKLRNPTFAQLSGHDTPVVKDGVDADAAEFHQLGHRAVGFADTNSLTGSTEHIIDLGKGGILMTTRVSIAGED